MTRLYCYVLKDWLSLSHRVRWHGSHPGRQDMKKICDISPLFFSPLRYIYGREEDYIQFFSTEDEILLQVISDEGVPNGTLRNVSAGTDQPLSFTSHVLEEGGDTLYYTSLTGLDEGVYYVTLEGMQSEPFEVRTCVEGSVLIRVSHKDNNSVFDNVWWVDDEQQFVSLRVEGGFKPEDTTYQVESENFRNQFQEIIYLYSLPYNVYRLTLGQNSGLPEWFADWLNRAFSVSHTEVDGVLYRRSEDAVPEKTQTMEDSGMYTMKMSLERAKNNIVGAGGVREPGVPAGGGGNAYFQIAGAKDGEMLIYDGKKGAFVNEGVIQ